jgi:hypothetical protein
MNQQLNEAFFRSLVDFAAVEERVRNRLSRLTDGRDVLRFFVHYASWNGCFANGVATLTSMIGNNRDLFLEPGFPRAVADRSNFIAGYFFDAARDEYDDHINPSRDSHRCMAQASLISMKDFFGLGDEALEEGEPPELGIVNSRVMEGYSGAAVIEKGRVAQAFYAMGYHLGSELLADREFSLIDEYLRKHQNALVQHLMRSTITLAGTQHRCYAWVGVHSGHGGGVEADHFDHAAQGARHAIQYLTQGSADEAMNSLMMGFRAFEADHARFFLISTTN